MKYRRNKSNNVIRTPEEKEKIIKEYYSNTYVG